ncbi:MAG: RluA family pseudouridine synthase [Proteobacteria bacterium]|nr:RluA family pseudouridine synthase [Pseudomonadota bacterium]
MEQLHIIVTASDAGRRLDALVPEKHPDLSRSQVQKAIRQGQVRVNGGSAKPSLHVADGDRIEIDIPEPVRLEATAQDIPLDVLYEDDCVVVINKPAGMVVHPACGNYTGTLVNALLHHCRNLSGIGGVIRPGIVHRLDKGTSGVLVAAKNDKAHHSLSSQFKEHTVTRKYNALVFGSWPADTGTVQSLIGRHVSDRKKMSTQTRHGRDAITHWRVLETFVGVSLVEAVLETGRTHQVRVHFSSINHPVVGDDLYGADKKMKQIASKRVLDLLRSVKRPLLHAYHLTFSHPDTGVPLSFEVPLPADFADILSLLRSWHA